jgi:hypothetical protein
MVPFLDQERVKPAGAIKSRTPAAVPFKIRSLMPLAVVVVVATMMTTTTFVACRREDPCWYDKIVKPPWVVVVVPLEKKITTVRCGISRRSFRKVPIIGIIIVSIIKVEQQRPRPRQHPRMGLNRDAGTQK